MHFPEVNLEPFSEGYRESDSVIELHDFYSQSQYFEVDQADVHIENINWSQRGGSEGKVPVAKPDDLRLIPRNHTVEGDN